MSEIKTGQIKANWKWRRGDGVNPDELQCIDADLSELSHDDLARMLTKRRGQVRQLTESNDFLRAELTATRKELDRVNAELTRLRRELLDLTDLTRSK